MALENILINVGASSNDRTGDSLRTAFQKVNGGFTELYTAVDGFSLTNSIPSLSGNSGKYLTNNGSTLNWSAIDVPADISDLTDNTNLLSSSSAVLTVSANPPASPVVGKLWYDTESGRTYVRYDNSWVDANPRGNGPSESEIDGGSASTVFDNTTLFDGGGA